MPFSRMDPSCTIGFYAKNQKDFESLCSAVSEVTASSASLYVTDILIVFAEEVVFQTEIFLCTAQGCFRGSSRQNSTLYVYNVKVHGAIVTEHCTLYSEPYLHVTSSFPTLPSEKYEAFSEGFIL